MRNSEPTRIAHPMTITPSKGGTALSAATWAPVFVLSWWSHWTHQRESSGYWYTPFSKPRAGLLEFVTLTPAGMALDLLSSPSTVFPPNVFIFSVHLLPCLPENDRPTDGKGQVVVHLALGILWGLLAL